MLNCIFKFFMSKFTKHLWFLLLIFSNQSITSPEFFHCLSMDFFLMVVMCFCRMVLDSLPKWVLDELIVLQLISCGKFALWSLIERNASLISYFGTFLFFKLICLLRICAASLLMTLMVFSLLIEYSLVMLFFISFLYLFAFIQYKFDVLSETITIFLLSRFFMSLFRVFWYFDQNFESLRFLMISYRSFSKGLSLSDSGADLRLL